MATYTSIHSGTAIDDAVTKIQNLDLDVELAPYATQTYVSNYLNNNSYVTQTQVQNTLTSGDYQTSTQVENRITNKGYATTTYVDGQIGGLILNKVLQSRSTSSSYRPILILVIIMKLLLLKLLQGNLKPLKFMVQFTMTTQNIVRRLANLVIALQKMVMAL